MSTVSVKSGVEQSAAEKFSVRALGPLFWLLATTAIWSVWLETTHGSPVVSFSVAFACIICLAKFLGDATEVVSSRLGSSKGSLMNATFGNATELILGIFAIREGLFPLIKMSIFGGIFGNLMLVGGLSVFIGGALSSEPILARLRGVFFLRELRVRKLSVEQEGAQAGSFILWVGAALLLVVTMVEGETQSTGTTTVVTAVACLAIYSAYLFFSLVTNSQSFEEAPRNAIGEDAVEINSAESEESGVHQVSGYGWSTLVWVLILGVIAGGVGLESDFFVSAIEPAAEAMGLHQTFVAFVIVALAGGIAEHWSAISAASGGKMALAFGIVVGSSVQLMLFVLPLFALYSIAIGQPTSLAVEPRLGLLMLASFLLWDKVSSDGKFNWFEGFGLCTFALLTWGAMFYIG
jgi:Ca2+:H+ antiporter